MTKPVTLRPVATKDPIVEDAVVAVMRGAVGAHIGVLYRAGHGEAHRHLHLAWHFQLRDEDVSALPSGAFWVEPELDELALSDVRASARLIALRHKDGRIPYAFRQEDARFELDGVLRLNNSRGLTCATFALLVFAHAGVELLDVADWETRSPERRREDEEAQARLVAILRSRPESREHAERIATEVGRIRAEEVAAASGLRGHPVAFLRAEEQGRFVREVVASSAVKRS
jgi:hypothetical protein